MSNSQRDRVTAHIREYYGIEPERLWEKYPGYAVFRHPGSRKWFALVVDISKSRLGLPGDDLVDVLDIKCSPVMIGSLLMEKGFLPAYHMNKTSWISVLLDGTVPDETVFPLLELSYDSVAPKRKHTNPNK